jgi:hypothetical protein
MEKEFIPYEQALALKELGFDEPCFGYYVGKDREVYMSNETLSAPFRFRLESKTTFVAPLYQQAFRWFREKYKMDSVIIRSFSMTNSYHYNIVIDQDYGNDLQSTSIPNRTYQQAEQECLKKLIEIVKK